MPSPSMPPHLERALADLDETTRRKFAVVVLEEEAVTQAATPPPAPLK